MAPRSRRLLLCSVSNSRSYHQLFKHSEEPDCKSLCQRSIRISYEIETYQGDSKSTDVRCSVGLRPAQARAPTDADKHRQYVYSATSMPSAVVLTMRPPVSGDRGVDAGLSDRLEPGRRKGTAIQVTSSQNLRVIKSQA